jgi:hypothetical protein
MAKGNPLRENPLSRGHIYQDRMIVATSKSLFSKVLVFLIVPRYGPTSTAPASSRQIPA